MKFPKIFLILALTVILAITQSVCINAEKTIKTEQSPKTEAKGAVLIDFKTGRVLWEKNSQTPMAMASTTKIMTAIMAIENASLSDIVTVSKRASLAPPTKMKLIKGEKISLENLLYSLMMQSSNDAAVAIAEHIGGTVENFCAMMTEKAKKIGALDTVFKTPNGLDLEDHHSTAYDMAMIARYALKNEDFRKIITTKNISFKSDKQSYSIVNKNRLLSEYPGGNGVKTGFTGKAGHCFVGSAEQNGVWLISVVLASGWGNKGKEQKWVDTKNILNYGFKNYEYQKPLTKGQSMGNVKVLKSEEKEIELVLKDGLEVCIKKDGSEKVNVTSKVPEFLTAPIQKGETLGMAEVYIGDELVKKIDLIAKKAAYKKNFYDYFKEILKFWASKGIL